jgi:TolB-like protein/DNA-binding winged helix-turn-helix (wHTH) protein/tetratricopeptide (TPR) repeat protein
MNGGLDTGFRLGPWEVRPTLGRLTGPEGALRLEPKVMAVLVCLAGQPGEVVTRDELITKVWRGRMVSDEVLSRCISLLRSSLGDNSREPRLIQTVPTIGYRLIAPVEPLATTVLAEEIAAPGPSSPPLAPPDPVPARKPRLWPAAIALLLAAAAYFVLERNTERASDPPSAAQPTVAVLPFVNRSDDKDNEYFSDGLTEELILRLSLVPGLQVVASTSAFAFKNHTEDVRSIADRLGVDYVLEGNVRKEAERIRIVVQLIEAASGFHIWSEHFDTQLHGIFGVQDRIANEIVAKLRPQFGGQAPEMISTAPLTEVLPAYELLLQGRYHLKRREEAPIRRSIELFEQAIELDPAFGHAYRELARAIALLPYYSYEEIGEMSELAQATLERGRPLVPGLEDIAQDVIAFLHFANWEWIEAEQGFRRALANSPNDPDVHQWYSEHLASVGHATLSLQHAQTAKKLDVISPVVNDRLAVAYMWADENEQARRQFALANELGMGAAANPDAYLVLLLRQGDYEQAREILFDLQKLFAQASDWIDPFFAALRDPAARPAAREALARAARERGVSLQYVYGAWLYLDDADAAMEAAFELLDEPAEFNVEFLFAREARILRRHPRFGELVTAIGLTRYWDAYGWPEPCARQGEAIVCH